MTGWLPVSSKAQFENSVGDSIKMELLSIIRANITAHTSIWYYRLDDVSEVRDPKLVVKGPAQPWEDCILRCHQRDVASRKCAIRTE